MAEDKRNSFLNFDSTPALLSQAERGDTLAAKDLLRAVSNLVAKGEPLPGDVAFWLSQALTNIADGADPKSVLRLKKQRGKPAGYSEEYQCLVATSIHFSPLGRHKGISKDGSGFGAYAEASERFNISENTAEKYYHAQIADLIEDWRVDRELRDEHEDR